MLKVMESQSQTPTVSRPNRLILLGLLVGEAAFFSLTNPRNVPSVILICAFLLLGVLLYAVVRTAVGLTGRGQSRRLRYISIGVSGVITLLLLLNTIGQLTVRDVITLIVFLGLLYFYIVRVAQR
jgi:uncharacterized membrane protein